jgi:hypothetical protein
MQVSSTGSWADTPTTAIAKVRRMWKGFTIIVVVWCREPEGREVKIGMHTPVSLNLLRVQPENSTP